MKIKKLLIIGLISFIGLIGFIDFSYAAMFRANALTGGAPGALDSIDGVRLNNGDITITVTSTNFYIHYLNASSGQSESSPDIISPDNNAGDKRWILTSPEAAGLENFDLDELKNVAAMTESEGQILYYDATTSSWKNTSILYIDDVNNRLGIGTATPTAKLEINGGAAVLKIFGADAVPMFSMDVLTDVMLHTHSGSGKQFKIQSWDDSGTLRDNIVITNEFTSGIPDLTLQPNGGNVGIGTITPDRLLHSELDDASNSSVTYPYRLTHTTSGTPATGIGAGIEIEVETSASNNEIGATIEVVTTDVTAISEDFDLVFKTMTAGASASEKMRIKSTGEITITGDLTVPGDGKFSGDTFYANYKNPRPTLQLDSFDSITGWSCPDEADPGYLFGSMLAKPSGSCSTKNLPKLYYNTTCTGNNAPYACCTGSGTGTCTFLEGTSAMAVDEAFGYNGASPYALLQKDVTWDVSDYSGFTIWYKCSIGQTATTGGCGRVGGDWWIWFYDGTNIVGMNLRNIVSNPEPGTSSGDYDSNMSEWFPITWSKAQMIHHKQLYDYSSSEPYATFDSTFNWANIQKYGFIIQTSNAYHVDMMFDNLIAVKDHPEGYIMFKFDDGDVDTWDYFMPILAEKGWGGNASVPALMVDNNCETADGYGGSCSSPNNMTSAQIKDLYNNGWSIISHLYTHTELGTLADSEIQYEFLKSKRFFEKLGIDTNFFDLPGGGFNKYGETGMNYGRRYYHGTFGGGTSNGPGLWNTYNPYYLAGQEVWSMTSPASQTAAAEIQDMEWAIDLVDTYGGFLVLLFHNEATPSSNLSVSAADFQTIVDYVDTKTNTTVVTADWYLQNKAPVRLKTPKGDAGDGLITTYSVNLNLLDVDADIRNIIICDTTSVAPTPTLPTCDDTRRGWTYKFKLSKPGANNCTIGRNGSTIDGAASDRTLSTDKETVTMSCNGNANWVIEQSNTAAP